MSSKITPESLIKPVVSLVCTAAICITGAACVNKALKNDTAPAEPVPVAESAPAVSAENDNAYLTEAEAAKYIGIDAGRMAIMRKNLKMFDGAYMFYSYVGEDGKQVEIVMYQKDKLDSVMEKNMKDKGSVNFKYLEEALEKAEKAKK